MCYPYHFDKPNTLLKLPSKILASGATKYEQTTKNASFCTQNEWTTQHCGLYPTIPTDMKMAPPV